MCTTRVLLQDGLKLQKQKFVQKFKNVLLDKFKFTTFNGGFTNFFLLPSTLVSC